ncbi:MAG: hypothetical protein ACK5MU_00785 [Candidatus Saccharimonadales bacterium]
MFNLEKANDIMVKTLAANTDIPEEVGYTIAARFISAFAQANI